MESKLIKGAYVVTAALALPVLSILAVWSVDLALRWGHAPGFADEGDVLLFAVLALGLPLGAGWAVFSLICVWHGTGRWRALGVGGLAIVGLFFGSVVWLL